MKLRFFGLRRGIGKEAPPRLRPGDTAFDAKCIREACDHRKDTWVVPRNPERVVAGPKGNRPKVRSLINGLTADKLVEIRRHAGRAPHVAQRWFSPWRVGPKVKSRTY